MWDLYFVSISIKQLVNLPAKIRAEGRENTHTFNFSMQFLIGKKQTKNVGKTITGSSLCYLLLWVLQAHHQLELLGMLLLQMEIFTRPLLPFISFVANETSWWSGFWRMDTHTYPCPAALLLVTCIYTHPSAFLAKNFYMFYPNWPYYFICELTLVFKVMLKAFIFILNFWLC